MKNQGLLIGIGTALVLGAVGVGVYFGILKKGEKKTESGEKDEEDISSDLDTSVGVSVNGTTRQPKMYESVAENLGKEVGADKKRFIRTLSDGSKAGYVEFTVQNNRYAAYFYDNGRIWVGTLDGKNLYKGNYTLGGKKINVTEGFNKGRTFSSVGVIATLKDSMTPVLAPSVLSSMAASAVNFVNLEIVNEDPFVEPKMSNYSSRFEF